MVKKTQGIKGKNPTFLDFSHPDWFLLYMNRACNMILDLIIWSKGPKPHNSAPCIFSTDMSCNLSSINVNGFQNYCEVLLFICLGPFRCRHLSLLRDSRRVVTWLLSGIIQRLFLVLRWLPGPCHCTVNNIKKKSRINTVINYNSHKVTQS